MSILSAIFLGLIQGIAEFLPISSSGHLSILQNLFNMQTAEEGHMFFDVLLHLGTLISVCIVYWADIRDMVVEFFRMISARGKTGAAAAENIPVRRQILMIIITTLPLVLIPPINDYIEQLYYHTVFIGIALILTGGILYVSDRIIAGHKKAGSITVKDALLIGLCQAVTTIPGLSRSGTTIAAGLVFGLDREYAVKYSFLISLPAILGANILSIGKAIKAGVDVSLLPAYFIGMVVAAAAGVLAIKLVNKLVKKGSFGKFSYYCWGAGALAIILSIVL